MDAENALRGILRRWKSLAIRHIEEGRDFDMHRHPQRDAGCRSAAEAFLEGFVRTHRHALVVFDHHGCGWEDREPQEVEDDLQHRLARAGWDDRCAAIVIAPELEAWVWSDSPNVESELGWSGRQPTLREWLASESLLAANAAKPADPKAVMERAMRHARKPISPHVFVRIAETAGLNRCEDRAFLKLKTVVRRWYAH
ncbi:MAG: hypothetical protein NTV22_01690 [bacterium]|nr:hypothetical protein [bacterium]